MVFDQQEKVDSSGIYVQGRYAMSKIWTLSAGLRYDEVTFEIDDRYLQDGDDSGRIEFSEVSPSIGIDADLGEYIVFATFSSAFETPTTTELANPDASGGFNPSLRPQLADNYELGIKGTRFDTFYELSVFRIDIEDELVPFELPAFPGRTFYQNAGTSHRRGVEAALAWQDDNGWAADVSWTWSDFTFDEFTDDNGNNFGGKELPGLPQHFAYAGLSYDSDNGWHARLEAIYSGSLYADNANEASVDSYVLANFRASRAYRSGPWLIRPYVGINNLFDERYNSNIRINAFGARYYEPAPDRNVYAGIDVRYGGE
jgi:iron complex outermembrane receptor protein